MTAPRKTAAFIFDIDGTIIDSMPFHLRAWDAFFARHRLPAAGADFFRRTAGRNGADIMREVFGPLSDEEARALVREKESLYRELFAPEFREIAGFTTFVSAAKAMGIRLACASAGDPDNIEFALSGLGLRELFDATVGAYDVERGKPEPDMFLLAAERVGTRSSECLVFEDAPLGIEAARRAGMLAVAIGTGVPADELAASGNVVAQAPNFSQLDAASLIERHFV